ncbi:SUMF1/EgtB/PvdO family nonheme iron enzyme [bacterium]|nr:SUMF1/EgtB/PvdO family nonheme iron enzyme [bacterium]
MVWIPGCEFTMGTDSDLRRPEEKPAHRVKVDGFWMGKTGVTNTQFREPAVHDGAESARRLVPVQRRLQLARPPQHRPRVQPGHGHVTRRIPVREVARLRRVCCATSRLPDRRRPRRGDEE